MLFRRSTRSNSSIFARNYARRTRFTAETLCDSDLELIERYLDIIDKVLDPAVPKLHDADGEPLEMHRLVFDIESPEKVLDALKSLDSGRSEGEIISATKRTARGHFKSVEFNWTKAGNHRSVAILMATDWDTFERWLDKLRAARANARARDFELSSPEPAELPETVWDQAAEGRGGEAVALLGLAKIAIAGGAALVGAVGLVTLVRDIRDRRKVKA